MLYYWVTASFVTYNTILQSKLASLIWDVVLHIELSVGIQALRRTGDEAYKNKPRYRIFLKEIE